MGQEIEAAHFHHSDFVRFSDLLKRETALLHDWFATRHFSRRKAIGGLELEGWLISPDGLPQPANEAFLERAADPDVVAELSKFNFELNVEPQALSGNGLRLFEEELTATWLKCQNVAASLDLDVVSIGILPSLKDQDLCPANMSKLQRYRALNEQLLRLRKGIPIHLEIVGHEHISSVHRDVMLEAGTTSFQIHLQVPQSLAARYWNAATILSAPLVAISANSPFLFGHHVWEETRIPLFEQSLATDSPERRVTLGSRFVGSIEEIFIENRDHYPVILPTDLHQPEHRMAHVRLHNGAVWRWNRPLIGFDDDGTPHLRIEHRPMAAGPTVVDMIANMAFYYGLVEWLVMEPHAPELRLLFASAKQNFYEAARLGLGASIDWYDGKRWNLTRLIQNVLLDQARKGLRALKIDSSLADRYLAIVEERVASGRTGAAFQSAFAERHRAADGSRDLPALVRAYLDRQRSGQPVHTWTL